MTAWKFDPPTPPLANPNGSNWADAFIPHFTPPIDPQTVIAPIPESKHMQFYEALLEYNNSLSNFKNGPVYTEVSEGVIIHKITVDQALAVSTRIKASAPKEGVGPSVVAACLAIESTLDPLCENHNIGLTTLGISRSNPTNNPLQYDMGIAQIKLEYSPFPNDFEAAKAFAFDIDQAIPYHCGIMASHILWAQNLIQKYTGNTKVDPRLMASAILVGTGAYNFGETGMLGYFLDGEFPSHCQHVIDLEEYFSKALGAESVFANLPPAPLPQTPATQVR